MDFTLLKESERNTFYMTCKDYKTPYGVASQLNKSNYTEEWYVKGPMGLGLDLQKEGNHFVFVGGTGILVFLDLVAALVLQLTGTYDLGLGDFKLILYYTAPSNEDALGLDLLQAYASVCKAKNLECF